MIDKADETSPRTRAKLPVTGMSKTLIESHLNEIAMDPVRGHWSTAFRGPKEVQEIGRQAYNQFLFDNGIFSLYMPYMQNIEQELTDMCVSLFHPTETSTGNMTSGGSESIYCALHAAREWAAQHKPEAKKPNIVTPFSGHATLSKGCHYIGLDVIRTELGEDYRADVDKMRAAINENTIALYASAPCWPYALIDPIEEIGALAEEYGLWLHVDACIGGYILPFMEKLGVSLPKWDFSVPGVKSISADLHKYAYCPKPASTVLWREADLQQYHYVMVDDWPTGPYTTANFAGSRSGGPIFAAWSVMKYLGEEGYLKLARELLKNRDYMIERINEIPGLCTRDCDAFPLPFGAEQDSGIDLAMLVGGMNNKGWIILATHVPPLINLPLDAAMDETVMETFLSDLAEVAEGIKSGKITESGKLRYG